MHRLPGSSDVSSEVGSLFLFATFPATTGQDARTPGEGETLRFPDHRQQPRRTRQALSPRLGEFPETVFPLETRRRKKTSSGVSQVAKNRS